MFADVALPKRRYQVYTYLVPPDLQDKLRMGTHVLVPLGHTTAQGIVIHLADQLPRKFKDQGLSKAALREITDVLDGSVDFELDSKLVVLARQVTDYYLAPPASGLRLIFPPPSPVRLSTRISITDGGRKALENSRLTSTDASLLTRLSKSQKGLTLATIRKTIKDVGASVTRLTRKGWIEKTERVRKVPIIVSGRPNNLSARIGHERLRDSDEGSGHEARPEDRVAALKDDHELSKQSVHHFERFTSWNHAFLKSLERRQYDEFLVHETSHFRERYLSIAVKETLTAQGSVLILTPEVHQALQLAEKLTDQFGNRIGLFHGGLPPSVRSRRWHEIQAGHFDVVVGTRIALFLPLPTLKLVWVDHEEDPSLKEEQSPYYHVREVARMRALLEPAILVMSSAHPSLETVHQFLDRPLSIVSPKPHDRHVPDVEVVNLRQTPYGTLLSDKMIHGMHEALSENGLVILFLNRKGFSRSMMCKDCGYVPTCLACGVTLPIYKKPPRMICPYCGQTHLPHVMCPSCHSIRLEPAGFGTEGLEEAVKQQFPEATVSRVDREIVKTPAQEADVVQRVHRGEIDIVIGTELLFHRRIIDRARFVGIPYADGGLHIPDFRSAERTYHLLVQAIEFTSSNPARSNVILQTFLPSHHVMRAVAQHDPQIFYEQELAIREALGYPPFTQIVQIAITGNHADRVVGAAKRFRDLLETATGREAAARLKSTKVSLGEETILGPIPSFRARSRGTSRYVIVIKSSQRNWARELVQAVREELEPALRRTRMALEVNVDPVEIS